LQPRLRHAQGSCHPPRPRWSHDSRLGLLSTSFPSRLYGMAGEADGLVVRGVPESWIIRAGHRFDVVRHICRHHATHLQAKFTVRVPLPATLAVAFPPWTIASISGGAAVRVIGCPHLGVQRTGLEHWAPRLGAHLPGWHYSQSASSGRRWKTHRRSRAETRKASRWATVMQRVLCERTVASDLWPSAGPQR